MKKLIFVLLLVFPLVFTSCGESAEETTAQSTTENISEQTTQETTTAAPVTMAQLSPSVYDVAVPINIERNASNIAFSSFDEISAKDSALPDSDCEKVLKSDNSEYFFMETEGKILVIIFGENGYPLFSASYKQETGALEYLGDDTRSWYFNEDGSLFCMVYTYSFEDNTPNIYTFYTADGQRDYVKTYGGCYSGELALLSDAENFSYQQKYSRTAEVVSEY